MKKMIATGVVLASVLAAPAFAAPPKHHAAVEHDPMAPYGQYTQPYSAHRADDVVSLGDRVIGTDPDPNIRSQMVHDPIPTEY